MRASCCGGRNFLASSRGSIRGARPGPACAIAIARFAIANAIVCKRDFIAIVLLLSLSTILRDLFCRTTVVFVAAACKMAAIPASNARDLRLRNVRTGQEVEVDPSILETKDSSVVRQLAAEVEPLMHNADISVDWEKKSYSFTSYPSLWLFNKWYYVVVGAFLVAACSQLQFLFPCGIDYSPVTWGAAGTKYCVPTADLGRVTQASCPLDICSKRIPVTMQTFAVLLNGAIAGPSGWMAVSDVRLECPVSMIAACLLRTECRTCYQVYFCG